MLERNVSIWPITCLISSDVRTSPRKIRFCRDTSLQATGHCRHLKTAEKADPDILTQATNEGEAVEAVEEVVVAGEEHPGPAVGMHEIGRGRTKIKRAGAITIGSVATTRRWRGLVARRKLRISDDIDRTWEAALLLTHPTVCSCITQTFYRRIWDRG